MDFERRLEGLQRKMAELRLGLVVYGAGPEFRYLTGLHIDRTAAPAGAANALFVPRDGPPVLVMHAALASRAGRAGRTWIDDVRTHDEDDGCPALEGVVRDLGPLGVRGGRIGLDDKAGEPVVRAVERAAAGAEVLPAKGLMDRLRLVKDAAEVKRLKRAADLTTKALAAVVPRIREGVTQRELEEEVAYQGRTLGASGVSFEPAAKFVKRGSEVSSDPFTYPPEKGLVAGTSIAFDMGLVVDGYCADFGRSFYFGRAGREVSKAYEALHRGMLETVSGMHEGGMKLGDLFPALERTLDRFGFGDHLRARLPKGILGHSIGIEVHEYPWISPGCDEPLRANMVLALEPKVWRAGEYYLRVEDMVLVGERETTFITEFDRELFQL